MEFITTKFNYIVFVLLMMIGFYGVIVKRNLVKKIIGLNILQTSIILFFVSAGSKKNGTLPILTEGADTAAKAVVDVSKYINPLPHVLMLTAIVVMVATLGVALAILIHIYKRYGTLEEDEIMKKIGEGS